MLIDWRSPPSQLQLQPTHLHLWLADLRQDPLLVKALRQILSAEEQARADRFYFEKDRLRFTLARGGLRIILSRYLNQPAAAVRFAYGVYQKPSLAYPAEPLYFNLAHSQDLALYAVAWDCEVGIDLEHMRTDCDYEGIASRFFSAPEQQELAQLSPDLRIQGFFNGWTRKEAVLKALGKGLTVPLAQIEVSLMGAAQLRRIDCQPDQQLDQQLDQQPDQLARWWLSDLQVAAGYAAAVAASGQNWQVTGWELDWKN
ncbi:MAG: 4'-phosphopantetheinyl transferase superfamily protein [Pegethrix bostrychoides GSE-TBD4-15B]|jgi:4'-phosphopantetheinyl transferase|uniref:4'-phosphopantetheinyl transferase superfamily protein n=1 Tax=Pegethrix bostrychoides GSE-TBD4-15B TaxID=2839662 RepID=A0A951PCC0_9CYAN|nr:4'-phosphopantetheinyl transferase superfamily protein [Pegethrix bostrychoides GSE-TBD4-15B]